MKNLMLKITLLLQLIIVASVGFSKSNTSFNSDSQFNNAGDPIPGLDISLDPVSNNTTNW
ncbi:MAG: hypothetical protein HOB26_02705 [Flavobacteriales bacterium]|jgi:hypothetical protein|nr:hypothetical protein [Flavobacteriales bacterium]MBT6745444.1 hypothetical protein [Flavobacteriales bacterium]